MRADLHMRRARSRVLAPELYGNIESYIATLFLEQRTLTIPSVLWQRYLFGFYMQYTKDFFINNSAH